MGRAAATAPRSLTALLAAVFLVAVAWALLVPAFQAPDENAHFGYVQSVADGRLPGGARTRGSRLERLTEPDWKQRALTAEAALEEARTETARLWSELHERRADENEQAYYRRLYESQVDSVSWKVTRPLRDAKTLAVKVQRKLAES